ncbi:hypothetical protein BGW38_007442, partial [Lunasporangiospora selenospora]
MSAIPDFPFPCLASATANASTVYLAGAVAGSDARLDIYAVNLASLDAPSAIPFTFQSLANWQYSKPKACFSYPGNVASTSNPFMVVQFGSSVFTNVYPNSTMDSGNFQGFNFVKPNQFALTGAVGLQNWYMGNLDVSSIITRSTWSSVRTSAANITTSYRDYALGEYPTAVILIAGTVEVSQTTPGKGFIIIFDTYSSGQIYTSIASAIPMPADDGSGERVLKITRTQSVDMSDIRLTDKAFTITVSGTAYIFDK